MDKKNLAEILDSMGFFETLEEDDTFVYCYEPEEGREYLVVSDELGNMPKEGEHMIVACYSPDDVFLWQLEVKDVSGLYSVYEQSGGGLDFIKKLETFVKS